MTQKKQESRWSLIHPIQYHIIVAQILSNFYDHIYNTFKAHEKAQNSLMTLSYNFKNMIDTHTIKFIMNLSILIYFILNEGVCI